MHRATAAPQGRKELLLWLNGLCNSEYPAVESLRDGAAYCTIIEAAVNRIAANLEESGMPEAASARDRAAHAATALNHLDWSATAVVCESIDPSTDSMAVRKSCRENMTVLQEMLRSCVPHKLTQVIDVERLCSGKLQDHMRFLQWLYQFMNKALMQYSKAAIERRSTQHPGEVEGVKLNRAQVLLEQKRKPEGGRPSTAAGQQRQAALASACVRAGSSTARGGSAPARGSGEPPPAFSSSRGGQKGSYSVGETSDAAPSHFHQVPTASSTDLDSNVDTLEHEAAVPAEASGGFSYPRAPVVVPAHMKGMLGNARREVEELEAMVMEAHEEHLSRLTRAPPPRSHEGEAQSAFALSAGGRLLAEGRSANVESPSLQEMGQLLEERDALAQVFNAVDSVVREYHAKGVPSRLLADLCAILYP